MRRRSAFTAIGTVCAVVLPAVLLAACATVSPLDRLAQASTRTVEAGTARMVMAVRTSSVKFDGDHAIDLSFDAEGVVDFARSRLQLTQKTDMGGVGISMEMVADEQAIYMKGLPAQMVGKAWIKEDLGAGSSGAMVISPTNALTFLEGISSDIEQAGAEEVRGTPTTRYTVTIEPRKVLDQQGLTAQQRKQIEQALRGAELGPFPADVWLDRDGRLRKLHYVIRPKGADTPRTETTLELFDFGVPAAVELPPADQVATAAELAALNPLQGKDPKDVLEEFKKLFDQVEEQAGASG